jgi:RNA polymerase sigma factor (sigma-70 family)
MRNRPNTQPELSERYFSEIRRHKLLTAAEEIELGRRVQAGDAAARERLITSNLRLVVKLAHGYAGFGMAFEDLVAEGNVGLIRAADRFDPERGVRFGSYAALWIKQAMRSGLSERSRTIRVPSHILEKYFKINAALAHLRLSLGRDPTDAEIGAMVDLPASKVLAVRDALRPVRSLEEKPDPDATELDLMSTLVDDASPRPDKATIDGDLRACLGRLLANLNHRERLILVSRFGLNGADPQTLDEVGDRIGLTRERVRQIQNAAIDNLRKGLSALERTTNSGRRQSMQYQRTPSAELHAMSA